MDSEGGGVYTDVMRRIQIHIDESIDETLQLEAERTGRSKASLIRECVAVRYGVDKKLEDDPITALVGTVDIDPADIDDVVYGR